MAKNNGNMHSGQQRQQDQERRNPGQQNGCTSGAGARQSQQSSDSRNANKSQQGSQSGKSSNQQK